MNYKVYAPLQMYFAAKLLVKQLKRLGKKVDLVDRLNPNDTQNIWIIYNNSMSWKVPKYYVSYQTEQIGSHWFNKRYYDRLKSSLAVWEYNEGNLPCYKHLNNNIQIVGTGIELQPKVNKDIDFLFYGALSERRKRILAQMPNVKVVTDILGADMQKLLARTKTVLNIHYYDKSPLETFRINECLSHGCNVISEVSISGDEAYKDVVRFCKYEDMQMEINNAFNSVPQNLSKYDNFNQIKKAINSLEKNLSLQLNNNTMLKISKYEFRKGTSSITFRPSPDSTPITINADNITDELVALATKCGKGHVFVELAIDKKKVNLSNSQLQDATSTSKEVKIEEEVLSVVQEIKQEHLSEADVIQVPKVNEPKKKGRPAKSKG